jgi:hypothetical protein
MNKKNVKRIVAMALAIGTVSAVASATNVNLLSTKAYASTNDTDTLDSLELDTSSGSNIKLYESSSYDSDEKVDSDEVEDYTTYYAKTSSSTVTIGINGPSSKYVRVFKGTSDSTKGKKISSDISLSSGITTLTVRVYSEEPDDDIRYDEDDDVISEYTIEVEYTGSDSTSTSNTTTTNSTAKVSQWVQLANGQWQYNDATGNPVKNSWFYDKNAGKSYYLNSDGIRQTGWILLNGKYYYLNSDGSLAVNTTIGGYKVGADGAWIKDNAVNTVNSVNNTSGEWKSNSKGWWYAEGSSYATGWKKIGSDWYYFYSDGYMAHDTKIGSYYVNSNGAWSTDVPASFSQGVRIGMTEEQVLRSSWGRPTDINKTTNQYGTYEQWVYRYGDYNADYLYFENGILISIQN